MGAWPEPLGGNASQAVRFGPLAGNAGGLCSEMTALAGTTTNVFGATTTYCYPFTMGEYFIPLGCGMDQSAPTLLAQLLAWRFGILNEQGVLLCSTAQWETQGQAATYNEISFSTTPTLPPGGYYLGFDLTTTNQIISTLWAPAVMNSVAALGFRQIAGAMGSSTTFTGTNAPMVSHFLFGMVGV
jgi:hypothetical protein